MVTKLGKKMTYLRQVDYKHWITTLWLVKRTLDLNKIAHYTVLRVDLDTKLKNKLKRAVVDRINGADYKLEAYDFLTADLDDGLLTIDSSETDFVRVQNEIDKGFGNKKVDNYDELLDSWAYVIDIRHDANVIYGVRKINKFTKAAKMKAVSFLIFRDKVLSDLDDEKVFVLDTHIDFFVFEGTTFISNKKEFESAMNFRQGMEDNRDTIMTEFVGLKIFNDVEPIRKIVGSNLNFLRKISAIQKSGYYKDKSYFNNLIRLNKEEKWGLTIKDGVIVVNEDNVELILTLLNNNRLKSPINQEVFDASVKKKVG
ncbi:MAG TPA: Kiwa anti-phage protein KwaB-like domain-containing protein [Candidatus Deferrimicrobiaceae bacterium]|jgi:hypothetical protein